jgi:hypothetical protein
VKKTIPQVPADPEQTRVVERGGSFYWQSLEGDREHGPFATLAEAEADMQSVEETLFEPGETLAEAEAEIGIADWIDPDTGEPAEEGRTRTEDH